jgi:hypothetical protein
MMALTRKPHKSRVRSKLRDIRAGDTIGRPEGAPSRRADAGLLRRRTVWFATSAAAALVILAGGAFLWTAGPCDALFGGLRPASVAAMAFVGSESCAGCHRTEAELWRSSQHKQAMDHATEKSVLGDFADASFDYYGVRSRFFRLSVRLETY